MEDSIKIDFKNWVKTWTGLKCPKLRYNGGPLRTLQGLITCSTAAQFLSHITWNYFLEKDQFFVELRRTVGITMSNNNILLAKQGFNIRRQ
jgi:hypothetical protein